MVEVVHRVAAIACLAVVAAIGPAEEDILAVVGMAYMVVGSIVLAAVDMVAAQSLVVVATVLANSGLVEVAAYVSPSMLTL